MQWSDVRLTSVLSLYAVYKETNVFCQLVIRSASLCFSLVNSLVNMTLPAFAAERRAAALLLLDAAVDRYLLPARRSAANPPRAAAAVEYMALSTLAAKLYFLIQMLQAASGKIMRLQQRRAAES